MSVKRLIRKIEGQEEEIKRLKPLALVGRYHTLLELKQVRDELEYHDAQKYRLLKQRSLGVGNLSSLLN